MPSNSTVTDTKALTNADIVHTLQDKCKDLRPPWGQTQGGGFRTLILIECGEHFHTAAHIKNVPDVGQVAMDSGFLN